MVNFQTSFIPKKPTPLKEKETRKRRGGLGVLGFVAFVVFLLSLIGTGGLYLYRIVLEGNIERMSTSIARVQEAIDPELIAELRDVDARIETAKLLLSNRTVASPIFRLLEDKTLESVGYSQFQFTIDDSGEANLLLSGAAEDYSSLALQSDTFGATPALREPIFENLRLDQVGNVTFSFKTPLERTLILYENNFNVVPRFVTDSPATPSTDTTPEAGSSTDDLDTLNEGLDELLEGLNF